ncbi:MAG: hypothetical protein J6E29_07270 [Prevotella sp.]|nr:hypothetical protein [Prevotella sp.]
MTIHSPKGFHIVVGWIGVVFFGLGGFYMLYGLLKERLTGKPFAESPTGECPGNH